MENTDLPIGFILSIAVNHKAMKNFSNLNDNVKSKITNYIQSSTNGDDAQSRINTSIEKLQNNEIDFFNNLN